MKTASERPPALRRREGKGKREREGDHKWRRLFLAILVVVLLHLPFLLLPRGEEARSSSPSPCRLAAISCPEQVVTSQEKALWQWIDMTEPSQWYYPTGEGFSRFNRRSPLPWPVAPSFRLTPLELVPLSPPSHRLSPVLPPPDDLALLPALPPVAPLVPAGEDSPLASLPPQWRREGGGVLTAPPSLSPDALSLLEKPEIRQRLWQHRESVLGETLPRPATVLELQFLPGFSMPRVLLRRSCGVPELDRDALRALRSVLRQQTGPRLWEGAPASRFSLAVEWLR
ncbi:MAG: hypothetical protein ACI4SG_01130 [Oligosphaeraceae bacterium]